MRISLFPVGGYPLVAVLAAILAALFVLAPVRASLLPRRRRVLIGLRVGVVILVILALLRPTLVYSTTHRQSSTLVLLVDDSRSMQVADAFGNRSRWQALEMALGESAAQLSDLKDDVEIKIYAFDADAQAVGFDGEKIDLPKEPKGTQTAIGNALQEVLRREAGKRLAGIVLLTDGAQRALAPRDVPPQVPARHLADLGFSLHTVIFGQTRGAAASRDVALSNLQVPDTVFVKNELDAQATARVSGFVNTEIPIELWFESAPGKMTDVNNEKIRAKEDGQQVPVELTYVPQVAGEYKLTVRAKSPPGDSSPTNNELSTFVTVRKGGVNVLYMEGAHPIEAKFLRRALAAFRDLHVDYLWMDARAQDTRPADLAKRFEPGKYDVFVIGDLDSTAFRPEELDELKRTVEQGAGLMMLGGLHSFGPGGYQKTALADLLPVTMGGLERQNFDDAIAADLHVPGPIKMQPTAQGEQSRMMLLDSPEKNKSTWSKLPALEGANRFRALSRLANVLAESSDQRRWPLLVAQAPGNGRVLAFAGDSTWHWAMQGYEELHKRFWRQLILWLAKKDQQDDGNVWVQLAQRRYQPGGRVEFRAGVLDKDGHPATDAVVSAEIVMPDAARRPVRMSPQNQEYAGSFYETDNAGDYTVVVTAKRGSESLGAAQARFLVYEQDLELENPVADVSLLQSLASLTGGQAMAPEQLQSFLEKFKTTRPDPIVEIQAKQTPWDTWPFFLAFVGLLSTEWFLRKRWGLV